MKCIIRCSCGGIKTYVENSMGLLYPGMEIPKEYIGRTTIRGLMEENPDTNLYRHLETIVKKSGRYAYYIEYNDKGDIVDMANLITGKKTY